MKVLTPKTPRIVSPLQWHFAIFCHLYNIFTWIPIGIPEISDYQAYNIISSIYSFTSHQRHPTLFSHSVRTFPTLFSHSVRTFQTIFPHSVGTFYFRILISILKARILVLIYYLIKCCMRFHIYSIRNTKYHWYLILGRLRKGMKNPGVFQKNGKSPLSPPCLSLSLRENERFPIPFWQISEKTEIFTPSLKIIKHSDRITMKMNTIIVFDLYISRISL